MQNNEYEETVQKITRIILTNQQKMIREDDLKNLCNISLDFNQIVNDIYTNLKKVGFELITSRFLDQKFFILTTEGKDDTISPSQYGTLALILALSKETDENIKLDDIKEIFSKVWDDVEFLIENDYIRKINFENLEIIKVTPLGKAILKNIIQNLQVKNLINVFQEDSE